MVNRNYFPIWSMCLCLVAIVVCSSTQAWSGTSEKSSEIGPKVKSMVIVTPQRFESELKPFIDHKRGELPIEVAILEKVLVETPGADDPEKLKRFLYGAWKDRQARYVLLVGDASVLPVRYIVLDRIDHAAYDTAFYASDMYYADVAKANGSFDDWHARKDGDHALYFGEIHGEKNKKDPINFDKINYQPKLAVGRWPVNTPEQVRALVTKTITFENQLKNGNKTPPRVGLIVVGGWVDSRDMMDRLAHSMPKSWNISKRYYSDARRKVSSPPPTESEIVGLLNSGVDLLIHSGHGSSTSWRNTLSLSHINQIKNAKRLPVIISAGCSTGRFTTEPPYEGYLDIHGVEHKGTKKGELFTDYPVPPAAYQTGRFDPPGLGKQLTNRGPNGAIAYIGCNTGSQPCALTLVEGFVTAWAKGKGFRLGDCWVEAIDYYFRKEHLANLKPTRSWYPPSIFFQAMKYMVYGDPSLSLPR
ncbi:MAG: C25 family cysteine peptidase [Desulfomonilaceae bacterium]